MARPTIRWRFARHDEWRNQVQESEVQTGIFSHIQTPRYGKRRCRLQQVYATIGNSGNRVLTRRDIALATGGTVAPDRRDLALGCRPKFFVI